MQPQMENYWCWAATAVAINAFLDPALLNGQPAWTQPELASALMTQYLGAPVNCSPDKDTAGICDQGARLDDALAITKNLKAGGARYDRYLDFASIKCWLDAHLPVGVRIVWSGGGAHFVALSGYLEFTSGDQFVIVEDPLNGVSIQDYSVFVASYQPRPQDPTGRWQDTILTTA